MTSTYQDFAGCSVTTSNYKWLTAKLLAAQKQYNVRPYFQCKIVDDTIAAQSPLTLVSGGANLPKYGKFVTAPDGALIGVGLYSDNIVFFKVADGTNGSSWASNTILATDVNINPPANTIPCTISVSDFINGTYRIDVYYVTFPAGGNVSQSRYTREFTTSDLVSLGLDYPITYLIRNIVSIVCISSSVRI